MFTARFTTAATVLFAIAVMLVATGGGFPHGSRALAADTDVCTAAHSSIVIKPTMPATFAFHGGADPNLGQDLANCDAWQSFVYLNWPAKGTGRPDPTATFGSALETHTVWVSYDRPVDFFKPGTPKAGHSRTAPLTLNATSEAMGNQVVFGSTHQAGSFGWIVGQGTVANSNARGAKFPPMTFYDIWVNLDEEYYITANSLQYVAAQKSCVAGPAGIQLPKGSNDVDCRNRPAKYGLNVGAIETKAALLDLGPAPLNADRTIDMAKATRAFPTLFLFPVPVNLNYPADDKAADGAPIGLQTNRLVGLVGFHIIRKVPGAQRFLWATFEHVRNAPAKGEEPGSDAWWYFNPKSTAAPNANPSKKPCPTGGCYYGPSQIVRTYPIDAQAQAANQVFHSLAGSTIFRYYELVNVQWQTRDYPIVPGASLDDTGLNTDFSVPALSDKVHKVANTTMETFRQNVTCIACHANAPISTTPAPAALRAHVGGGSATARAHLFVFPASPARRVAATPPPQPTGAPYGSDFSFVFSQFGINGTPPAR